MDAKSFIKLVKERIVKYYNTGLKEEYKTVDKITKDNLIIPGENFMPPEEIIRVTTTNDGVVWQWHVENVFTEYNSKDHLFFDATYYANASKIYSGKSEFVLNAEYRVGLLNQHFAMDDDSSVIEMWEGPRKA